MSSSENVMDNFNASMQRLISDVDDYVDRENSKGQLQWVSELGWPSKLEATEINRKNSAAALKILSRIIKFANEKNCYDLLRFLFDTLADTVRDDGSQWRFLLGECGVVDECLDCVRAVQENDSQDSEVWVGVALRLLTNCCADPEEDGSADEIRAAVVAKLPAPLIIYIIVNFMTTQTQRTQAVSLIYNVGSYEENFRTNSVSAGLKSVLWMMLEDLSRTGLHDTRLLSPICEMLTWPAEGNANSAKDPFRILSGVLRHDLSSEDVESLIDVALNTLQQQGLPQEENQFLDMLDFIYMTCFVASPSQDSALSADLTTEQRFLGDDEEALVKPRESLITQLSVLSGRPHSALNWSVNHSPLERILGWTQVPHFQIRICALTLLGNFAYQSERLNESLMEDQDLCNKLTSLLKSETNGLVLKTALGAVQRFAKAVQHRIAFGKSGILVIIAASWAQVTNLPLQQAALSTTRNLLSGCLVNINLFMSKPAASHGSLLHLLLETFQRSDVPETQLDIAWTLERMWRSLYTDPGVRKMHEGGNPDSAIDETAKMLFQETIPRVYETFPEILEPFLAILTSDNKDQLVAATYTLTIILNEERNYQAIYDLLCQANGRIVLEAIIQDKLNPKVQTNCQALIHKLKSHFINDDARTANLDNILQES